MWNGKGTQCMVKFLLSICIQIEFVSCFDMAICVIWQYLKVAQTQTAGLILGLKCTADIGFVALSYMYVDRKPTISCLPFHNETTLHFLAVCTYVCTHVTALENNL